MIPLPEPCSVCKRKTCVTLVEKERGTCVFCHANPDRGKRTAEYDREMRALERS